MEKTYITFEANNASLLNEQILNFVQDNDCVEVERSAPAVVYAEGIFTVYVTSAFASKTEKVECIKEIEKNVDNPKYFK